jgi:hypothetical protein
VAALGCLGQEAFERLVKAFHLAAGGGVIGGGIDLGDAFFTTRLSGGKGGRNGLENELRRLTVVIGERFAAVRPGR